MPRSEWTSRRSRREARHSAAGALYALRFSTEAERRAAAALLSLKDRLELGQLRLSPMPAVEARWNKT